MNQTREAARQILGNVSDIQAVVSMCGLVDVNGKLAAIREKAAFIFEGKKGSEKIIAGYEGDADLAMTMLTSKIDEYLVARDNGDHVTDADRLMLLRLAELFVSKTRVYFERRVHHGVVVGTEVRVKETNYGE